MSLTHRNHQIGTSNNSINNILISQSKFSFVKSCKDKESKPKSAIVNSKPHSSHRKVVSDNRNICFKGEDCIYYNENRALYGKVEHLNKEILNLKLTNQTLLKNYELSISKYKSLFSEMQKLKYFLKLSSKSAEFNIESSCLNENLKLKTKNMSKLKEKIKEKMVVFEKKAEIEAKENEKKDFVHENDDLNKTFISNLSIKSIEKKGNLHRKHSSIILYSPILNRKQENEKLNSTFQKKAHLKTALSSVNLTSYLLNTNQKTNQRTSSLILKKNQKKEEIPTKNKVNLINKSNSLLFTKESKESIDNNQNFINILNFKRYSSLLKSPNKRLSDNRLSFIKSSIFNKISFSPLRKQKKVKVKTNLFNEKLEKSENFYYKIKEIYERQSIKKYRSSKNDSLLALSEESIIKLISNPVLKELFLLCQTEDMFIEKIISAAAEEDENRIMSYCDLISKLIIDYKALMLLISRIKKFLRLSVNIYSSLGLDDSLKNVIINAKEILQCEEGGVYIYDVNNDMLVTHKFKDNQKMTFLIDKSFGLPGYCYLKNEKLNLNDPYNDERFSNIKHFQLGEKEKYNIHSILLCPIRRNDNSVVGVLELINKVKSGSFNRDDEELIEVFAFQLGFFLEHSISYDDKLIFISRLRHLNEFRDNMYVLFESITNEKGVYTIYDIRNLVSSLFISLYGIYNFQIIFIVNESFFVIFKNQMKVLNTSKSLIGIVGNCYKSKEKRLYDSIYDCVEYNNIVDLESYQPILTFPIFQLSDDEKQNEKVISIIQTGFPFKRVSNMTDLSENDEYIINEICSILSRFFTENRIFIEDMIIEMHGK